VRYQVPDILTLSKYIQQYEEIAMIAYYNNSTLQVLPLERAYISE
jgi:hypothetical protein